MPVVSARVGEQEGFGGRSFKVVVLGVVALEVVAMEEVVLGVLGLEGGNLGLGGFGPSCPPGEYQK